MITIIPEALISSVVSMAEVVAAVEGAYRDFAASLIHVPDRITLSVRGEEHSCIFIPANHLARPYYGLKQASSFPGNRRRGLSTVLSDIHLYSAETGEPLAVIAANQLTALKTGAASAVATRYLAPQGPVTLCLIGCGVQARTQLSGTAAVRTIREIRLFDVNSAQAAQMKREIELAGAAAAVGVFADADACVDGADVVCTTTTSTVPVFDGRFIKQGCHINAVGSFTPAMQEIDSATVARADKLVVDVARVAWEIAGDLLVPLSHGVIDKGRIYAELGEVVNGSKPGRERDAEITLYESLGFAALDLAVGIAVYEKCLELGLGIKLTL
jgi:ornithine cyclodeaminase/alanine dehydrogenase-like protein (mu-crystallin family)